MLGDDRAGHLQQPLAEGVRHLVAEDDHRRVHQVDQVRHRDAQVLPGPADHLGGLGRAGLGERGDGGEVGLDAEVGTSGSVTFEVLADGVSRYTSPVLRGGQTAAVAVGLARPSTVTLRVHATGDGNAYDHANWAGARLSCD